MAKRRVGALEARGIRLRLLDEQDLEMTLAWRNQENIRRWFLDSRVVSPEQHRAWFDSYARRDDDLVFVIEERARLHRPVGQVALSKIDWAEGRAEFGRLMIGDPEASGLGIATEATRLLVETALTSLGLREMYLEVLEDNVRATAIYRTCGFVETARNGNVIVMRRRGLAGGKA